MQSPQSDTADDGCAAVICFIRLGVSLASSTTAQPSTYLSGKEEGNHPSASPCNIHTQSRLKQQHLLGFVDGVEENISGQRED